MRDQGEARLLTRTTRARSRAERSGNLGFITTRGARWQFLHVAIDDHSRLAYAELLAAEDRHACSAFLHRAVAWYAERDITVERVLSDG